MIDTYKKKMSHFPTGIIVIINLNDTPNMVTNKVAKVFRQINEFAVYSPQSFTTCQELMAMIETTRQYPWPKSCHYLGFFFIGGKDAVESNSQPYFISVQNCIDKAFRQQKFPDHLNLIFFFDCCFCCNTSQNSITEKPFAFDLPPKSIVAFATSPGQRSGKTACITSWSNEFCKQLEKVQKGHTLTEVLELTIEKVIKEIPHFKQHPPQFFSSAGPIVLKGMLPNIIAIYISVIITL